MLVVHLAMISRRNMNLTAALLAAMMVGAAGCEKKSSPLNRSHFFVNQVHWSTDRNVEITPGIDEATLVYVCPSEIIANRLRAADPVVLWSDFPVPTPVGQSYSKEKDCLVGEFKFFQARDVDTTICRFSVSGSSSGTIVIAGETYDLSAGTLFLIAARQPPIKVRQLESDLSSGAMTESNLRSLGHSEPVIAEFFRAAETPRITE